MFKNILVPLDGSGFAEAALPVATRLCRATGAGLRLVGVHEPTIAAVPVADVPIIAAPDEVAIRSAQRQYLTDVAAGIGDLGGKAVGSELLDGMAGPALAADIERTKPDLVVMATHGRGPLSRFWFGSVADHLIRHQTEPLLLVRPGEGPDRAVPSELRHGLIPLDRSDASEAVLEPAIALAEATGARLTLLQVVEPILSVSDGVPPAPLPLPPDTLEGMRTDAAQYLEGVAERLRKRGLTVDSKVVLGVGVAGTVLEQLDKGAGDFVALATHGAGGFKRLVLGSVADVVIRGADKPVLVVGRSKEG